LLNNWQHYHYETEPVNANFRTLALAASLGLALPAARAELIKINGTVPPVMDAMTSLGRELTQGSDPKLPLRTRLERLESFRPTSATADKLRAVFGTATPLLFARQPDRAGRPAWRATLLPLRYASTPDAGVDWDAATFDLTLDKTGTVLDTSGAWPRASVDFPTGRFTARGMTLSSHQKRGYGDLWFGSTQARIASVRVEPKTGIPVTVDDLRFEARTVEHPKSADLIYESRAGAIGVAGERIEDVHFSARVLNVDKQVLAEFKAANDKRNAQPAGTPPATPEQQLEAMKPLLRSFARSAQARGTVIEIDDYSARYHGSRATLRGRIALAGKGGADLDDLKALARRIVARFEIKVPLAIVRDVAGAVAARQAAASQGNGAPGQMSGAQLGQSITDVIVGKLVGGGYARVENDALVSIVEWRDGELRANGKPVALPAVAPSTPSAPTSQTVIAGASMEVPATPLPPDALRARRVEASCRLPDYPDEVVSQNRPLHLVLRYRITVDGKVLDPAISTPSRFPAWDQAALAALAQCTYVPALQNGAPIELPMVWTIRREPGTARP
jgi:hypothetical protein